MIYWKDYQGHEVGNKRLKYDQTIYTFDIETTSYLILDGNIVNARDYLSLSDEEKERAIPQAAMYIWQFSINDSVYYGRTWKDFVLFLREIEENCSKKKIVFVHNLSFEFTFFCQYLKIKSVLSRKSRKVMSCKLEDFNIEFRCSLYMSNVKLEKLSEVYMLPVKKQVGYLDYSKLRHCKTRLTKEELEYCEYDCLVVYEYIKLQLKEYGRINRIPLTSTGQVRRDLQNIVLKSENYKRLVNRCVDIKPSVFNCLIESFAGGYTHANYMFTDEVLENVDSFDESSAYPYVMVTEKFPMRAFKKCYVTKREDLNNHFAYLLKVRFYNIRCKYYNNFISASKCINIYNAIYDNGRIIQAEEIEIILTDIDFKFILDSYNCKSYEIVDSYFSLYSYLPKLFIEFILKKYKTKTMLKGVDGKEVEYQKEKAKFNSLYGMCVTNMIRDDVDFKNNIGWTETELTNDQIFDRLCSEKKKSFLSFAWGVWVTAYARNNLLRRVLDLDDYVVYCDTDSIKLIQGYDKSIIEDYNKSVINKIKTVSSRLKFDLNLYIPTDKKGKKRPLGVFEYEGQYKKFITQGAKKYCVETDHGIEITVAGVPKSGNKSLRRIEDFRDNFIFDFKDTNKLTIMYNDLQVPIDMIDYNGVKYKCTDKTGACFLPTTYELGKSEEYAKLLIENSSKRAKFK